LIKVAELVFSLVKFGQMWPSTVLLMLPAVETALQKEVEAQVGQRIKPAKST
jgi:hypothetical protein